MTLASSTAVLLPLGGFLQNYHACHQLRANNCLLNYQKR